MKKKDCNEIVIAAFGDVCISLRRCKNFPEMIWWIVTDGVHSDELEMRDQDFNDLRTLFKYIEQNEKDWLPKFIKMIQMRFDDEG